MWFVQDEIRCCIWILSNVPRGSTAATCIKVLWIKEQLKHKLISARFLPFIKLPEVSWKHTDSLYKFSLSCHPFIRQLGSFAKRRVWHKVSLQDYNSYYFKEYFLLLKHMLSCWQSHLVFLVPASFPVGFGNMGIKQAEQRIKKISSSTSQGYMVPCSERTSGLQRFGGKKCRKTANGHKIISLLFSPRTLHFKIPLIRIQ